MNSISPCGAAAKFVGDDVARHARAPKVTVLFRVCARSAACLLRRRNEERKRVVMVLVCGCNFFYLDAAKCLNGNVVLDVAWRKGGSAWELV